MKLLTVAIPCYNSAEYMKKAVSSCLCCRNEIELIIVDDGSKDNTLDIAYELQKENPDCIRVIHQNNGGHGSAVNTGLANANGLYFKVLDSDDWFDEQSLKDVLALIQEMIFNGTNLDLIITNYVYEKPSVGKMKSINFFPAVPKNKIISWKKVKHFRMTQNLLMHSLIYRTKLLQDCGMRLPEHTFYVDNIYAYYPLPYVKQMYYLDVDLYRYYIGREGQSVNEQVMISRIDQQIKITKIIIDCHDVVMVSPKPLRNYMIQYIAMMMIVTSALLVREGSEESLKKRDEIWKYLKNRNIITYNIITRLKFGYPLQLKSSGGKKFIIKGYEVMRKIYKFN